MKTNFLNKFIEHKKIGSLSKGKNYNFMLINKQFVLQKRKTNIKLNIYLNSILKDKQKYINKMEFQNS